VNTPRCDEDRLKLIELTVFLLPSDEKVGVEVSVVDLQVYAVRIILLLSIKYALTVNPNIYVPCIIQFWTSIAVKKVNDVTRLQALVDKKKVIITEATIRDALRFDDAESIECLPNEEIFADLARMGYEKPSTKLTFYKVENLISQRVGEDAAVEVNVDDVTAGVATECIVSAADDEVPTAVDEPSIPSPPVPTQSPPPSQDIPSTSQDKVAQALEINKLTLRVKKLERRNKASKLKTLNKVGTSQRIDTSDDTVMDDVLSMQDDEGEPAELQEVVEVVTTAKLITEVVTAASATLTVEQMDEEDSRALKRLSESQDDKTAKKQKLDEEVEELKRHLQIVPKDEDDVYIEATPLALKVPAVDYEIYNENNKPYYKIKRADERRYPLTRFTLDQMLNNVRLQVEEESEVSLELQRFIRQQHQEGV
nr:hypothetical protein [Tanacetum cinerariifolium]